MKTIIGQEEDLTRKRQSEGETNTSLQVSIAFRERLKRLGRKGETYEEVITRILDEYEHAMKKGEGR